jgi:hypothetical protein
MPCSCLASAAPAVAVHIPLFKTCQWHTPCTSGEVRCLCMAVAVAAVNPHKHSYTACHATAEGSTRREEMPSAVHVCDAHLRAGSTVACMAWHEQRCYNIKWMFMQLEGCLPFHVSACSLLLLAQLLPWTAVGLSTSRLRWQTF